MRPGLRVLPDWGGQFEGNHELTRAWSSTINILLKVRSLG
jgi:hypothetical protein